MIGDPDLIKTVLIKDFDHFVDRRTIDCRSNGIVDNTLAMRSGKSWKSLRDVMSPTFTSGKIKGMFKLMCKKADDLISFSLEDSKQNSYTDMRINFGRYAIDTVACCAFGIECNSFVKEKAEFAKMAEDFFIRPVSWLMKNMLLITSPTVFNALNLDLDSHHIKFFEAAVTETLALRRKGQRRGDFLDLLLETRDSISDPKCKSQVV